MKNRLIFICVCCLSIGLYDLHASERLSSTYYFSHISGANGLSQSNVKAILQDSYGFMWFGTKNGLNRFDGSSIIQIGEGDPENKLGNHNISALYEDSVRQLWVGTDKGIYRYNPVKDTFHFIDMKTDDGTVMANWVASIVGDHDGNIWAIIPDQGVFRYRDGRLFVYNVTDHNHFKTESPQCICVRPDGDVWVGTWGAGLFRYNPGKDCFESYCADKYNNSLHGKNINFICNYGDWIAMAIHEGEVLKYHPGQNRLEKIDLPEARHTYIRNVTCIGNELWIGTHEGLFIVDERNNRHTHLKPDPMLPFTLSDKIIYTTYCDNEGGIWLGTMFGGVCHLPRRSMLFEKYVPSSERYSLGTKRIREITTGSDGNIWIGTEDNGVWVLDTSSGKIRPLQWNGFQQTNNNITLSMYTCKDRIICGLFKQGMITIQLPGKKVRYHNAQELNLDEGSVYSYFIDKDGYQWIGTGWGLYKAPAGSRNFHNVTEVGYDWIFDIFQDKSGIIWFASMGNGIWKHNPEKGNFRNYLARENKNPANALSSNSVSSIMQDSKERIWISTDRGGLCRYNSETDDFTTYSIENGFPDNVVYKVLEDDRGNLWFGTNKGLVCFNPDTKNIHTYTTKDGLLGNQFNYKSALKANDGKFYFGGIEGLIAFDPDTGLPEVKVPKVYFSKFCIYDEEITVHSPDSPLEVCIEHTDGITLPYNRSNISLDVSVLQYTSNAQGEYFYRMDPLDKAWIPSGGSKTISYANLPHGNYTLYVKASDGKQPVGEARPLSIAILPPWWATVWAYMSYTAIIVCLALCWFFWYRRRKERQMAEKQKIFIIEKEKELYESKVSFFTEIAHEVRTPLTLINGPLEAISEMDIKDERLLKNLNVIGQNSRRLLELAGQLLDFQKIGAKKFRIKYENMDISAFLKEIISNFESAFVQKKKALLHNIPEERIIVAVDKEAMTKIISNLLFNALKYGQHTTLVELQHDDKDFTIRVTSDGRKIPQEEGELIFEPYYRDEKKNEEIGGVGIGLPLARSLAVLHKGRLYLDDTGHPGNIFVLTIPLNKEMVMEQNEKTANAQVEILDEETSTESSSRSGYTLLLVEDNADIRSFILNRLRESFTVEAASNGHEGLEILRSTHIDLVLSDIMMPVMDGYELCRTIKDDMELCHIPVIFLTAKNDQESKINGLKAGAEAYVEKPFSYNYLKAQIISLLVNRQKEREAFSKRPFFPVGNMQMNKADEEFMDKVIGLIHENIADENFNVERMADILCMSRSSLLRKIKGLFNLSPIDFIRLIRLKKAAELISEGKYRIGDIGEMVGISSSSYFSKLFFKQFGMTPKEFEQQQKKK